MRRNIFKNQKGFSLVEILIVTAIATSMVFVTASLSSNLDMLQNLVGQKLQSRSDVDEAVQILIKEIRSSGPSSNGAYPINSASTSSLSFYTDVNKDGVFERVRYYIGTSTLQKGVITPTGSPLAYVTSTEILTTSVVNLVFVTSTQLFTYYDSAYTGSESQLSSPIDTTQIRVVKITFYADINPKKSPKAIFFSNAVTIRNLKSN